MSRSTDFHPQREPLEGQGVPSQDSPGPFISPVDRFGTSRREQHEPDVHGDFPPCKPVMNNIPRRLHTLERIHVDESQDQILADEGGSASVGVSTPSDLIFQKLTDSLEYLESSPDIDMASLSISRDSGSGSKSSDIDSFLHPVSPLDTEPAQSLDALTQQSGDVVNVTKGKEVVISHPGSSQYTQGSVSACTLAALNCARAVLGKERDERLSGTALLQYMMRPETIEEIVAICQKWKDQKPVDVGDIYQIPLLEESLKLRSTHSTRPSAEEFRRLLSDLQDFENSAALVIARPPEIIACFKISVPMCDVFVIFDPHHRPPHSQGPSFIFSISLYETAQRIETLLDVGGSASTDSGPDRQARLLGNFSGHFFTANERFKIKVLEAAQTRFLEMDISALQLKADNLDLKAQIDELNQIKLLLEGRVEATDRMLGELRNEIEKVKIERDRHNETIRLGWLERDDRVESQYAIIASLQAEVKRLQQEVVNKARERDSANASLAEEVSRLKEQLHQRDTLPSTSLDPLLVHVPGPLLDSSQATTVNGSPTLKTINDEVPNDNQTSKENMQTSPGGEPDAHKLQEVSLDDGISIAPPAKHLPRADVKGKVKERERLNGSFWRILPPSDEPEPPDIAKNTGAQRPSPSPDDDNPWRLSSSHAGPSGLRNREQRSSSSKAIAASPRLGSSVIKAAPRTSVQDGGDQAAKYQRMDPSPSLSSTSLGAMKRPNSSDEWRFRVEEYYTPLSSGRVTLTPPPKSAASFVPKHLYPNEARVDFEADRALAEQLQYEWNVDDSETAREIERALREENRNQNAKPKRRRTKRNKPAGPSNSKVAQDVARPSPRPKQEGYDWMEALARDQALQEGIRPSATKVRSRNGLEANDNGRSQASAKGKHQSTIDYEGHFATMPMNDAAWRRASPPPRKVVNSMLHNLWRAKEEEKVFHDALRIQQQYDDEEELMRLQDRFIAEDILFEEELAAMQQPSFECGVCLETLPMSDVALVDECDHELCRECMKGYVSSKIQERRYPIPCPLCQVSHDGRETGVIGISTIETLGISEDNFHIYEELQMTQFAIPVECKGCRRTVFIDRQEHQVSKELTCPLPGCQYKWCKACQQPIDAQLAVEHSCDGSKELDALILGRNWKKCPQCATPIEKVSGCNHMTCISPGCNTHFCYVCGNAFYRGPWCGAAARAKSAHLGGPCGVGG